MSAAVPDAPLTVVAFRVQVETIFPAFFVGFNPPRFDIYSCGQNRTGGGYAVIQVKHSRNIINLFRADFCFVFIFGISSEGFKF